MEVKKVKPQTTFRQGISMVEGEWVSKNRRLLSVLPGACCSLIDPTRAKMRDIYDGQQKKTGRGVFYPAPWKEKRAARAQGGIQYSLNLVPYVASISTINRKNGFVFGLLNGA